MILGKRFWSLIAILVLMTAFYQSAHATENTTSLRIHKTDITDYPVIKLELGLSDSDELNVFNISENGYRIENVDAKRLDEKSRVAVTLLIDVSGSMAGQRLVDAKKAANWFVEQIKDGDLVSVIAFSSGVQKLSDFTGNKAVLQKAVSSLQAKGETALYDALAFSFAESKKQSIKRQSVILLSDGGDTASRLSGNGIAELASNSDVPVQAIMFKSNESNPEILKQIALNSGGHLFDAPDSESLFRLYSNLARDINNRYRVSYRSISSGNIKIDVKAGNRYGDKTYLASISAKIKRSLAAMQVKEEKPVKINIVAPVNPLIIGLFAFMSVCLLVLVLSSVFQPSRNLLAKQLEFYDRLHEAKTETTASINDERKLLSTFKAVTDIMAKNLLASYGFTELTRKKLGQAGLALKPNEYMVAHILLVILVSVLISIMSGNTALTILVILILAIVPLLIIEVLIQKRRAKFNDQLPEMLDFVANSMSVGLGLHQAIISCSKETGSPMSDELTKINKQVEFGASLIGALATSSEQLDNENFNIVVMGISIQQETGGNLSEILSNIATNLREKEAVKRQIKVLTSEGRLSATILIALPFIEGAVLYILNPEYMSLLFTSATGLLMLALALFLLTMGILWLKKIVSLEEF